MFAAFCTFTCLLALTLLRAHHHPSVVSSNSVWTPALFLLSVFFLILNWFDALGQFFCTSTVNIFISIFLSLHNFSCFSSLLIELRRSVSSVFLSKLLTLLMRHDGQSWGWIRILIERRFLITTDLDVHFVVVWFAFVWMFSYRMSFKQWKKKTKCVRIYEF